MNKTVIELTKDGLKGYLAGTPNIFAQGAFTLDITKATDYSDKSAQLDKDIGTLVLPGDEVFARSGLRVDECNVVEVKIVVDIHEQHRRVARDPHKYNRS